MFDTPWDSLKKKYICRIYCYKQLPLRQSGASQPHVLCKWAISSSNQRAAGAVFPHASGREGAELQPAAFSLCVLSPGRSPGELWQHPALNNALFFLLLYRRSPTLYTRCVACGAFNGRDSMSSQCYPVAMDLGVCQLRNFSISFLSSALGKESASVRVDNR